MENFSFSSSRTTKKRVEFIKVRPSFVSLLTYNLYFILCNPAFLRYALIFSFPASAGLYPAKISNIYFCKAESFNLSTRAIREGCKRTFVNGFANV